MESASRVLTGRTTTQAGLGRNGSTSARATGSCRGNAVSKPLGIELSGRPAQLVARGHHAFALPTLTARARVLLNWGLNASTGDGFVSTDFQDGRPATLPAFEHTDLYQNAPAGN
jgi:hypothetical protein